MPSCNHCGDPTREKVFNQALGRLCRNCQDDLRTHVQSLRDSGMHAKADRILRYGMIG